MCGGRCDTHSSGWWDIKYRGLADAPFFYSFPFFFLPFLFDFFFPVAFGGVDGITFGALTGVGLKESAAFET